MYSIDDMEVLVDTNQLLLGDEAYPEWLRQIPDRPECLYYRGNIELLKEPMLAVVGTRKPTAYGIWATNVLVSEVAKQFVVVSGLAYGIDELAHQTTIAVGGKTVAVLGSGLDAKSIYPAKNRVLAERIVATGGLLLSEYPDGSEPLPFHFPLRNRIIAGLAQKLIVIEAGEKSGTLITAGLALDYNREVWAVPGPINSRLSKGTNYLISQGARPVLGVEDLRAEMGLVQEELPLDLDENEAKVVDILKAGEVHIDELARMGGFDISELSGILTLLEMKQIVKNVGQGVYIRLR